jgi:hypothetical protein
MATVLFPLMQATRRNERQYTMTTGYGCCCCGCCCGRRRRRRRRCPRCRRRRLPIPNNERCVGVCAGHMISRHATLIFVHRPSDDCMDPKRHSHTSMTCAPSIKLAGGARLRDAEVAPLSESCLSLCSSNNLITDANRRLPVSVAGAALQPRTATDIVIRTDRCRHSWTSNPSAVHAV